MKDLIERLLDEMDRELAKTAGPGEVLHLFHIGRSTLVFHYGATGISTRDVDVVRMRDSGLEERAEKLFGKGSPKAETIGIYLE